MGIPQNIQQIVLNSVDEEVKPVGRGKKVSIMIANPSGSTFDVISYAVTAEEAAANPELDRIKHRVDIGITDLFFERAITGPVAEIGIEITALIAGNTTAQITQVSRASS